MAFINTAWAHEVYVLDQSEIQASIAQPSPDPLAAISGHEKLFLGWGLAIAILALIVLSLSVSRLFERVFDPFLVKLKRFAPLVARITLGSSLIASGWFGALFGPELPLSQVLGGPLAHAGSLILMIAGALLIVGALSRLAALIAFIFYAIAVIEDKSYMLNYANYLGEVILFLILGAGSWSIDRFAPPLREAERRFARIRRRLEPYAFLILRVLFGAAIFFASFYAKFVHSSLALMTVADYHLTDFFPFTPLFLVLGAFLVEALMGLAIAVGFEIRFVTIVFTVFLTMSLLFFGEAVWPHLILFGVNVALFCHGYDRYTLQYALFERKRKGEPVL